MLTKGIFKTETLNAIANSVSDFESSEIEIDLDFDNFYTVYAKAKFKVIFSYPKIKHNGYYEEPEYTAPKLLDVHVESINFFNEDDEPYKVRQKLKDLVESELIKEIKSLCR